MGDEMEIGTEDVESTDLIRPLPEITPEMFLSGAVVPMQAEIESTEERIIKQMLGATTLDDLDAAGSTIALKDYIGTPFTIQKIEWQTSNKEYADALPFYVLIFGLDAWTNKEITLNTGAKKVLTWLFQAERLGAFPCKVVAESNTTAQGFEVLSVHRVD